MTDEQPEISKEAQKAYVPEEPEEGSDGSN